MSFNPQTFERLMDRAWGALTIALGLALAAGTALVGA